MMEMAIPRAALRASRIDTHVQQAVIRLLLTAVIIAALLLHLDLPLSRAVDECRCLPVLFGYVPAGILLLGWSLALRRGCERTPSLHLRLGVALVSDIFVAAAFTALGGHYAPLSLPVFLALIIGYGWRFGAHYAFAASALGLAAFSAARELNPLFQLSPVATLGYYVCFIAVPMYLMQARQLPVIAPAALPSDVSRTVSTDNIRDEEPPPAEDDRALLDWSLVDELRATCLDDLMWQMLVGQFEQEAERLFAELELAIADQDMQAVAAALHRVRGAAASIGARQLDESLAELEQAAVFTASALVSCRQGAARTIRSLRNTL